MLHWGCQCAPHLEGLLHMISGHVLFRVPPGIVWWHVKRHTTQKLNICSYSVAIELYQNSATAMCLVPSTIYLIPSTISLVYSIISVVPSTISLVRFTISLVHFTISSCSFHNFSCSFHNFSCFLHNLSWSLRKFSSSFHIFFCSLSTVSLVPSSQFLLFLL